MQDIVFSKITKAGMDFHKCQRGDMMIVAQRQANYLMMHNPKSGKWEVPVWAAKGFVSVEAATNFLNMCDWEDATLENINCFDSCDMYFAATKFREDIIACMERADQSPVTAAISSRDLAKNQVRVRSSNIWSYGMNVKDAKTGLGDVVVQFKGTNGGPTGGLYMYYDVPVKLYRKWITAPSKGSFFWKFIRDDFLYRKLDGDRRGKLPNAVN